MLTPIVCFTCGLPLGDVAPIYHIVRRNRMALLFGRSGAATAPTRAAVDHTLTENVMSDVLDALRVSQCCRTHLVTAMLFNEHY